MTEQSKKGGRRPGAGRKRGSLNKSTATLKEMAAEHTQAAIDVLVAVMADNDAPAAARVAAADKLLDRGYGRPAVFVDAQVHTVDKELMENIKNVRIERLSKARERNRQVLIERGLLENDSS